MFLYSVFLLPPGLFLILICIRFWICVRMLFFMWFGCVCVRCLFLFCFGLLGKIHDLFGVGVNGNGTGHSARCTIFGAATLVWTFAGIVLFFDQVISVEYILNRCDKLEEFVLVSVDLPGSERYQMSIVSGCRNRHGTRATHVRVTQLIGQALQFVGVKVIVVPQDMIVWWSAGALVNGNRFI